MRRVQSRDTTPELKLRRLLTSMGYRYRLHRRDLPGSPDVVFVGRRLAVFMHGCFWHGHACARGARVPATNTVYWQTKIGRNALRDVQVQERLSALDWRSLVVWECELKDLAALRSRLSSMLDPSQAD